MLGRIRYRGDSFTVERSGTPVATIRAVPAATTASLRQAVVVWTWGGEAEPEFAADLERVNAADLPPGHPWGS